MPNGPGIQGAPIYGPHQDTAVRYTTDSRGRITGVWAYDLETGHGVRLPVSSAHKDWPLNEEPTYTFQFPSAFVSEAA